VGGVRPLAQVAGVVVTTRTTRAGGRTDERAGPHGPGHRPTADDEEVGVAAPSTTADAHVRLVVAVGTEQRHVALRRDVRLGDALRVALVPLDDPGTVVLDSSGTLLDPDVAVGEQVPDGAALHVVRPAPRPRRSRDVDPEVLARRPGPQAGLLALAGTLGLGLLLAGMLGPAPDLPAGVATAVTLGLAVLALVVALTGRTARTTSTPASVAATVATPVLGAAAGVWAVLPGDDPQRRLALVVALVCAVVASGARAVMTRRLRAGDDEAVVVLGALTVVAATQAATLLLDLPAQAGAAVLVGLAPFVLRVAPRLALAIPDEQLVDVSQVARTAESVRAPRPRALGRVSQRLVARTVEGAERRVITATAAGCVAVVTLVPGVVAAATRSDDPADVPKWGAYALVGCVLLQFVLGPRTARDTTTRWLPRIAAGVLLLEVGLAVPVDSRETVALAALVLGALVAVVGTALARGWRSVVGSRLGDTVEGLAVVLALPAAVAASGLVEVLRRTVGS